MSDALSLLRNFVKNKKDFSEDDDKIIFGEVFYPKNVKTNYLIYGSGKDGRPNDYYTLECLAFLIKHRELQHPMYVKNAGTRNISVVSRPDRRDLLLYLDGEVETTSSIDKNAPLEITMQRPLPYVKHSSTSSAMSSGTSSIPTAAPTINLKRPVGATVTSSLLSSDIGEPMEQDTVAPKAARLDDAASGQAGEAADSLIGRITRKFDESAAQSQRAITDNITALSESLTKEKIAALKAKKKATQRNQVSLGMELLDDDPVAQAAAGIQPPVAGSGAVLAGVRPLSGSSGVVPTFGGVSTTAEGDAIMKEIGKREVMIRNRFSVLQSNGKQFEKEILAYLTTVRAREEATGMGDPTAASQLILPASQQPLAPMTQTSAPVSAQQRQMGYNRFDQERYAAKDETGGFSIDTKLTYQANGGALSLAPTPTTTTTTTTTPQTDARSTNPQLAAQKVNVPAVVTVPVAVTSAPGSATKPKFGQAPNQPVKRTHAKPIIIVPNTTTSLITLFNCLDILQELKYVPSEEKRKSQNQNAPKDCEIIMHRRENGTSQQFKVIDNVNKLQEQDWSRVVAVFAQGKQWQFKDWPVGNGNPAEIFNKVKGFHLKMSGIPLDPNVAKWSVTVIELDPHKRHLDRARLLAFWDELERFMVKTKPYLCI